MFGLRPVSGAERTVVALDRALLDAPIPQANEHTARMWCAISWYAHEHRHSGIGLHTPADVRYGRAHAIREARGRVLDAAYPAHPERFVRKTPEPPKLPGVVWINKPENKEDPAQ